MQDPRLQKAVIQKATMSGPDSLPTTHLHQIHTPNGIHTTIPVSGHVQDGHTLKTHDDVPEDIREQLYAEEQQSLERHQRAT
jgi:hypothetical protein